MSRRKGDYRKDGEYMDLRWSGCAPPDEHYVYGDVTEDEFWQAMTGYYTAEEVETLRQQFGPIRHTYYRCVKPEAVYRDDFDYQYQFDCAPGRGASKCTAVDRLPVKWEV